MKLNVYVLRALNPNVPYDSYSCHVVAATSNKKAREMCPEGDEGKRIENGKPVREKGFWLDVTKSECSLIAATEIYKEPVVICSSYHAG